MDGASVNARLKAHAPEKRAGQPERTDAGGDTVITLRIRLQEVANQYERELEKHSMQPATDSQQPAKLENTRYAI